MKRIILLFTFFILHSIHQANAQTIETIIEELPPYFSILTTWGVRPEWDEKSENIYFLSKLVGDVYKIHIATKEISQVTSGFYHGGIHRVLCLSNGDLLLAMGPNIFDANDPEKDRHKGLGLYVLTKSNPDKPYPLNAYCDEGPAVSKNSMKIAWTLKGQREIQAGEIVYENGIPQLKDVSTIISYKDSSAYVRLETQDFRPPLNEELIYTHYWGDERDQYYNSQVFVFNLITKETKKYTDLPKSYNEAEGIFHDGKYMVIESDRHQPMEERNKYKLDIYKLSLDGSGEVERLADFSTRYFNKIKSDNPVVNHQGNMIAHQFGFQKGAGDGRGIFLFDLEAYEKYKQQAKE
ncbi:hypothetical protein SAMN00777080_1214 [Aquiflexum balticum DSM 16537]|uniref:Uncharacterized protein n=1 Tax=Aquiflexum balticum DSM 16537 TaxID=758820 RepID=A0A1W2H168_9BACT|nr:hypothetical protein [Aquiflexum balticum]SMD42653.1 hypothetical protein SAMN00777080_1214 [Aquiflexum balticum DSM 16537]